MGRWWLLAGVGVVLGSQVGCFPERNLPLIDEVPIEAPDFVPCAEDMEDQRIACIIDGDTFDIVECQSGDENRIRLLGVQAPEISTSPPECYGPEATDWMERNLGQELVTLTFDADCSGAFDRTLAYVWATGDLYEDLVRDREVEALTDYPFGEEEPAVMINEVLLRLGLARQYPEEIAGTLYYQGRLDAAAAAAEADRIGLYEACSSR